MVHETAHSFYETSGVNPGRTGGICVADDAEIEGTIFGGTGVRSAYPYHLTEFPYRLEAGTLNLSGIAGISAGLEWLNEEGVEKIHRHELDLLGKLQEGLSGIKGTRIWGTQNLERRVARCDSPSGRSTPSGTSRSP